MASPQSPRLRVKRDGGQGEAGWKHFEQRRHRMKPPDLFDEASTKYQRYEHFVSSHENELSCAKVRLANGHPQWQGFDEPVDEEGADGEIPEVCDEDASPMNTELGVRKAQFFDRCLRADRSVEYPRRPGLPPVKISSFRAHEVRVPNSPKAPWHRASTNESQEPKRNSSIQPGAAAAAAEEAMSKLSRFDTSMLDLVNQCRRVRLHPATTGLVRSDPGKLKLEYGFLTDERAEALTDSLKATTSEVREALFRSNGLSSSGAQQLLEALPIELECVDLSQNDLSADIGWCLAFRRLTKLQSLTLSDCQLADSACVELLNNLMRCKSLARIDLSRNSISNGSAFQPLLKRFSQLEELNLHWNHLGGEASALLQGVIECHKSGLSSLNLSWNPLGKFNAEENCQQLVRLFKETKSLRHLDLSRCDFTVAHCKILAEGLEENRTIVGLHVSGNEAHVDAQGYLVPRNRAAHAQEGDPHADRMSSLADEEDSCCWVCQRWRETKLRYTPGISGPDAAEVWVFTSIDGFTKPIKMQRQGEDFVTYVMAAPGPLRFVFQAGLGGGIASSRTAPQVELKEMIAAIRGGLGCYQRTNLVPEDGSNGVVLKLRAAEDEAPRMVEVVSFSTIMVVERPEDEPVCEHYMPRKPGDFKASLEAEEWSLENSLFAPHWEPLSGKQFRERCFEVDWLNTHWVSVLPGEGETIAIRDLLREHYAEMKVLYSSLCSVDWYALCKGRPLAFGIGLYQYTHMLVQHNLVGQDLTLEEADALFIAAAMPPKDTSGHLQAYRTEGRMIHRHGFFGLLVRLAIRFARGNAARGLKGRFNDNREQVKKALQYIFAKHLMYPYAPMKNNLRCVQWRESVLHTQVVEGVFRKHMQAVVDPLFCSFAAGRFLTPEEWFRMLDCMEVFPCSDESLNTDTLQMNAWDRAFAWQVSSMTQVEELCHQRSLQLVFVEFLEALARLVALWHSRKLCQTQIEDENGERWDYGMPYASPVSIFCLEPAVNDKETFAKLLDAFLSGPIPKKALSSV